MKQTQYLGPTPFISSINSGWHLATLAILVFPRIVGIFVPSRHEYHGPGPSRRPTYRGHRGPSYRPCLGFVAAAAAVAVVVAAAAWQLAAVVVVAPCVGL